MDVNRNMYNHGLRTPRGTAEAYFVKDYITQKNFVKHVTQVTVKIFGLNGQAWMPSSGIFLHQQKKA